MEQRYIEELCKDIVKRFGHKVETTNDFNLLSEDIYKVTNIQISESTLRGCFEI